MVYDALPVFKATYDLLQQVFTFSTKLSKDFRYTLGETVKKEILDICVAIYKANSIQDKAPEIALAREKIVVIKLYIRILHDMKQISTKQFAFASQRVEDISKQLAAWQKNAAKE